MRPGIASAWNDMGSNHWGDQDVRPNGSFNELVAHCAHTRRAAASEMRGDAAARRFPMFSRTLTLKAEHATGNNDSTDVSFDRTTGPAVQICCRRNGFLQLDSTEICPSL